MNAYRFFGAGLAAGIVTAALLAGACSGGDDGGDSSPEATAGATEASDQGGSGGPESTPTAAEATAEAPTATPAEGGGGSDAALQELGKLVAGADEAEYVVTYETDTDTPDGTFSGTVTIYQGGDRMRVDFAVDADGEPVEGTSITTPEVTYFCTERQGAKVCLELPGSDGDSMFPDPGTQVNETIGDFGEEAMQDTVKALPQRKIAGTRAHCFEISGPDGTGTACFSDEGVVLLMEMSGPDGGLKLEATDYRVGVSDADFEPPYPVVSPTGN